MVALTCTIAKKNEVGVKNPEIRKSDVTKPIGKNWAVIIGISKYQYSGQSGLRNLIFEDNDAKGQEFNSTD